MVHLLFVLFAVAGGLLLFRWPRWAWLHLPAAAWAAFVELAGVYCPLTPLEIALRERVGVAGYEDGFVSHYILPVLYPAGLTSDIQVVLGIGVVTLNGVVYLLAWRHHHR